MTDHLELPALLTAEPEDVADAIAMAIRKRRNVVYVGRLWRDVALVIRAIPESIFKRIPL